MVTQRSPMPRRPPSLLRPSTILPVVLCALTLVVGAAGCKQGNGGRCEVNDDCASGMCTGTSVSMPGVCHGPLPPPAPVEAGTDTGADVEADAPETDAGEVDAGLDEQAADTGADTSTTGTGTDAGDDGAVD
jgi:hypothetical protein